MIVPAGFGRELLADEGDRARAWLTALPSLVESYLERWSLTEDGPVLHGYVAVVLPVRRPDGTPAALKVGWPHEEAEHEALALRIWDGDGAVQLLDADEPGGALLLERLDATTSLRAVDVWTAAEVAGGLLRRLAVPAPPGL
ncbi:MAG TPA: aminoglycoside phosphotransferase family protein, partial [Pseudonocardiaceae bacterium]